MEIINFVKNEYWFDKNHNQQGLESSPGSVEYIAAYEFFRKLSLNGFIEIGSAFGGSFHLWSTLIQGKKISVDMEPIGQYPQNLTLEIYFQRNATWRKHFTDVYPVLGNSHLQKTVDTVAKALDGDLVDFLFIDAEHTYDGVKSDFEMYKHFVRPGGYVGFHDIRMMVADSYPWTAGCGVYWDELISTELYKYWEFENVIGIIQL
jgi:cephalosporin hydroxylase